MSRFRSFLFLLIILFPVLFFLYSDKNCIEKFKLNSNRLKSLILFLISSISLWGATLYIGFGDGLEVMKREHYLGLLFYLIVGVLTWLRLIYTI